MQDVFLTVLDTTGNDYNNPASPFFHQYSRGYAAINTLFPAADGIENAPAKSTTPLSPYGQLITPASWISISISAHPILSAPKI